MRSLRVPEEYFPLTIDPLPTPDIRTYKVQAKPRYLTWHAIRIGTREGSKD
jgi:hypothetical protein